MAGSFRKRRSSAFLEDDEKPVLQVNITRKPGSAIYNKEKTVLQVNITMKNRFINFYITKKKLFYR